MYKSEGKHNQINMFRGGNATALAAILSMIFAGIYIHAEAHLVAQQMN